MLKLQALQLLSMKAEKEIQECGDSEWIDELTEKLNTIDSDEFEVGYDSEMTFADLRGYLNSYKAKRTATAKKGKTTYYQLISYDSETEKSYKVSIGSNGQHGNRYKEHFEYLPKSQLIEKNNMVFVPAWIIKTKNISENVNKESKVTL
jgi:hypothetical protein